MKFIFAGIVAAFAGIAQADDFETSLKPWPPHPTPSVTSASSATTTSFIISITTLPGQPTAVQPPALCPTVTMTTRPAGCEPIRCPIPGCTEEQNLVVPCGCAGVQTLLAVEGCQTACPEGCMTRLSTYTGLCDVQTIAPFPLPTP
ncbi:hypothetical protein F4778DRAFT_701439 [Xylariomycetidae sp. FL2044]|nr:hypothetical protein F4778DRAFT_701439 [Xylariomycetidae sp. FL2044]